MVHTCNGSSFEEWADRKLLTSCCFLWTIALSSSLGLYAIPIVGDTATPLSTPLPFSTWLSPRLLAKLLVGVPLALLTEGIHDVDVDVRLLTARHSACSTHAAASRARNTARDAVWHRRVLGRIRTAILTWCILNVSTGAGIETRSAGARFGSITEGHRDVEICKPRWVRCKGAPRKA